METHTFLIHSIHGLTHLLSIPENISIFFAEKKFIDGQYLLMESNFQFRPRVELVFFDGNATTTENVSCPISSDRIDALDNCNAMQCIGDDSRKEASEAKIVTKIYFNRNSILFQVRKNALQTSSLRSE